MAAVVELDHWDAPERVADDVLSGLALLTRPQRHLIGHTDLHKTRVERLPGMS
jgi:hypothetical protein